MLKAKTPLLVGLLMIAGAVGFVFAFGSLDQGIDEEDTYPLYAYFEDATGLVPNSQIKLSGIEVGRLGDIGLDPDNPSLAKVELRMRKDITLRKGVLDPDTGVWVNGATAVRHQASLIGDYYVGLTPGIDGPALAPGDHIQNVTSQSGLSSVIKNLERSTAAIFPKLDAITDDIKSISGGLRESLGAEHAVTDLKQIREDVKTTTENVALLTHELRGFFKESIYPRGDDIGAIAKNVAHTAATINAATARTVDSLDRIVARLDRASADISGFVSDQTAPAAVAKPGTVSKAIAGLDKNLALLEGSLESVRSVAANIEQGKGTVGRLLNDDKLVTDIERVVSDVQGVTSTFARTQLKVQFRSEYFVQSKGYKSFVDFSLHPAPDKYYLLQLIDDPTGKVNVTRRVTASNDPLAPPVLVEDISETTSELKISAQMAKRWHLLTFRYGVMESTGGLGLDADLLDDSLNFKLDVFEFGRDEFPRVRALAQWEFLTHFFLSAGVDDLLNADSRDYFLGIGVRFYDDDLKAILPIAPMP